MARKNKIDITSLLKNANYKKEKNNDYSKQKNKYSSNKPYLFSDSISPIKNDISNIGNDNREEEQEEYENEEEEEKHDPNEGEQINRIFPNQLNNLKNKEIQNFSTINNNSNQVNSFSNDDKNNNNTVEDPRLNFTMIKLGLESLIHIFQNHKITFNDLLFLSKEDLNDLHFHLYQKNRILAFISDYSKISKNLTMEEIESFFLYNPKYNSLHVTEAE